MAKRLVLDRQHMLEMLSDPEFYIACPYFIWLRKTALAAKEQRDKDTDCRGCDKAGPMGPIMAAFVQNVRELHATDPKLLECVRFYLEAKKGSGLGSILIYYSSSKGQTATFAF